MVAGAAMVVLWVVVAAAAVVEVAAVVRAVVAPVVKGVRAVARERRACGAASFGWQRW